MLVFADAQLVYLAVPKTGSTAVEAALRSCASVTFAKSFKHMTAQRYKNRVAPFLHDTLGLRPETCAVMRDPLDQMRSWYKYRNRDDVCAEKSAIGLSFEEFVKASLYEDAPACAAIGSQFRFLTNARGKLIVDHLFDYEALPRLQAFLEARLNQSITFPPLNVSPPADTQLSPETEAQLRAARVADFALYQRIRDAGGYLRAATAST